MRHLGTFAIVAVLVPALSLPASAQGDELITVGSADGVLRVIDPVTGTTTRSVPIVTNASLNAVQCNGLARDPLSGQLFGIVRDSGSSARKLAVVDPFTGVANIAGTLPDSFAGLAFRADGVLFGVTGDGANTPETLFTINPANAVTTLALALALGNGDDGEAIAFGADGFLYHASGYGTPNQDEIFERIDTVANTITPVIRSGYDYTEMLSLTLWAGGNLLGIDLNDDVMVINTSGVSTLLTTLGGAAPATSVKGTAFLPSPTTQTFLRAYGAGCAGATGRIPLLAGVMLPNPPGFLAKVDLVLGPASTSGLLGLSTGNVSIPFPSASCQIQIMPSPTVLPALVAFTTDAAGAWILLAAIPPGFPPADLYLQAAFSGSGGLFLTNPVQAHFP